MKVLSSVVIKEAMSFPVTLERYTDAEFIFSMSSALLPSAASSATIASMPSLFGLADGMPAAENGMLRCCWTITRNRTSRNGFARWRALRQHLRLAERSALLAC
ncbi:MAG: hypothetical protein PHT39_05170 [Sphaerochaetaceae bacterium]|nr:hypothetical protein [Sphaerochaetaceae bacterium]MDD4396950.1 hypothetical protein [Sphaerochaetaceae bacterium]